MFSSVNVVLVPTAAITMVLSPVFKTGKFSSDKSGRPFRRVSPLESTTFAVIRSESIINVSPAASRPMICSSLPFVVMEIYESVPEGITPVKE